MADPASMESLYFRPPDENGSRAKAEGRTRDIVEAGSDYISPLTLFGREDRLIFVGY
jgi:hypothetical protein